MACLDRLPSDLRRFFHEAVVEWSVLETRWKLNKALKTGIPLAEAVAAEIACLREAQTRELAMQRFCWPARFGPHPATAALSTPMRYDEAVLHKVL